MRLLRWAICIGVFFNLIYDVLKRYGFENPEWFWYVGQSLEILLLFIVIRIALGRSAITNLGIYISIGVLAKEVFGNPLEINFIEYPIILAAYFIDNFIYKRNDRN